MTKLTETCLCLTLNKKKWQSLAGCKTYAHQKVQGPNLHFAFFKLIRTLEENILRGLKDWLKKCIFHPKITI